MAREGIYDKLNGNQDSEFGFQYSDGGFNPEAHKKFQQMQQMNNSNFAQNNMQQGFPQQGMQQPNQMTKGFPQQGFVQQGFPQQGIPMQNNMNPQGNFMQNSIPQGFPNNQNNFLQNKNNYVNKNQNNNNNEPPYDIQEKRKQQAFVHEKLNDFMTKSNSSSKDEGYLRQTIATIYEQNQQLSRGKMQDDITDDIVAIINGYGPLNKYLTDKDITEIICCTYDNIWVEKNGQMMHVPDSFNSEHEFRNIIDSKILQPLGRRVDDAQPLVNARLSDRSRVNVVINPIAADGPTLDIRKFKEIGFTIPDYIRLESMTSQMGEFLTFAVKHKKNIIVSGGTGSGKTTLLNCLSAFIGENEAVVTIEDTLELQLIQPCIRRLEARAANAEGTGAVTIRDCLVNALRMRPDRIIVGECRSHEVVDMLQAMNTGHDGSLTTVHANTPRDMIERLYTMYILAGVGDVPEKAVKAQIASAVHVIVQTNRLPNGKRKLTRITEIIGMGRMGMEKNNQYVQEKKLPQKFEIKNVDATDIILQDIYKYNEIDDKFYATGWIPTFWDAIMSKSEKANTSIFKDGVLVNEEVQK